MHLNKKICNFLLYSDDEAILSSKIASSSAPLVNNSGKLSSISTSLPQPFPNDKPENFAVSGEAESKNDNTSNSRMHTNLSKTDNHLPPTSDSSRKHPTSNKIAPGQPSVSSSESKQPLPQRQQKSRTRRVQKSQVFILSPCCPCGTGL